MRETRNLTQILAEYSFVAKICALRFCTVDTFEDFVQEGCISIVDKSFKMLKEEENTLDIIVRNCIQQQYDYYLRNYKDSYLLYSHPDIESDSFKYTLFGPSLKIDSILESGDMDFYETREIVRSFADKCSSKLKILLYHLYNLQ